MIIILFASRFVNILWVDDSRNPAGESTFDMEYPLESILRLVQRDSAPVRYLPSGDIIRRLTGLKIGKEF